MARMYPNRPRIETKSHAEGRLYNTFRDSLPDDYVVFHSVAWQVRDTRSGVWDGEADFVVVHPDQGVLVIEVKGGRIRYDGATGEWWSNQNPIKDPFEQARSSKYSLLWRDVRLRAGASPPPRPGQLVEVVRRRRL